jgi:hypothetical protein
VKSEQAVPDSSRASRTSTTSPSSPSSPELAGLWSKVLGNDADSGQCFPANGAGSCRAVPPSAEILEPIGQQIDRLGTQGAPGAGDLTALQHLIRA